MSLGGRNYHRGSTCHIMRQHKAEASGGQTSVTWVAHRTNIRIALHVVSDDVARKIFGETEAVDLMAMTPSAWEVRKGDGFIVTSGLYARQTTEPRAEGGRYLVVGARQFGRFTELGLQNTEQLIDEPSEVAA
jgi:hypothetical protein